MGAPAYDVGVRTGERITLIKRVAAALSDERLADVELTLREFGMEYDHRVPGGLYEMVVDAAQGASDEVLIGLNDHLHPDVRSQVSSSGGPWDPDAFRLFVSHTPGHRKFAGALRTTLKHVGIDCFVAHDTIETGREWLDEIESALNTCDALVAMLTPDFRDSQWCDQEVGFCVGRAVPIVGLRMPQDPHGFMFKYQGLKVHLTGSPSAVADELFAVFAKHEQTRSPMVRPIIQRYVRSGSFDGTREAFPLVTGIRKSEWTEQMIEDVLAAGRTNGQVREANLRLPDGRPVPEAMSEHLTSLGLVVGSPATLDEDEIPL
jgi:TIR domain-containing protein